MLIPNQHLSPETTKSALSPEAVNPEAVPEVPTPSKLDSPLQNPLDNPEVRAAFKSMQNTYYETFLKPPTYTPTINFEDLTKKQQRRLRRQYRFW